MTAPQLVAPTLWGPQRVEVGRGRWGVPSGSLIVPFKSRRMQSIYVVPPGSDVRAVVLLWRGGRVQQMEMGDDLARALAARLLADPEAVLRSHKR